MSDFILRSCYIYYMVIYNQNFSAEIRLLSREFRYVSENSQWENTKVQAQGACDQNVEGEPIGQICPQLRAFTSIIHISSTVHMYHWKPDLKEIIVLSRCRCYLPSRVSDNECSRNRVTKACIIYMNFELFLTLYKVSPVTIHVASSPLEGDGDVPSSGPSLNYPH